MKTLQTISKLSFSLILICFFLPFIAKECDTKKVETAPSENTVRTAEAIYQDSLDTLSLSHPISQDSVVAQEALRPAADSVIEKEKFAILKWIISPDGENLSGIGYVFEYYPFLIKLNAIPIALIFTIILLVRRMSMRYKNEKRTFMYSLAGLFSLVVLYLLEDFEDLKYGFWIALVLYVVSVLINLKIFLSWRKIHR